MIGCRCKACLSDDPRDKRLRPSVLLKLGSKRILIDTSPDFRYQALRYGIDHVDAILYTHSHADHILGLDDVRPFNFIQASEIPIFMSDHTWETLERTFRYVFDSSPTQSSRPRLTPHFFDEDSFLAADIEFQPVRASHGRGVVHGFRFGDCAYLTDHSCIPPESLQKLSGLDVLVSRCTASQSAIRHIPPSMNRSERSSSFNRSAPSSLISSHDIVHAKVEEQLPANVHLAYDGLEISDRVYGDRS